MVNSKYRTPRYSENCEKWVVLFAERSPFRDGTTNDPFEVFFSIIVLYSILIQGWRQLFWTGRATLLKAVHRGM